MSVIPTPHCPVSGFEPAEQEEPRSSVEPRSGQPISVEPTDVESTDVESTDVEPAGGVAAELASAVDVARAAVAEETGDGPIGEYVGVQAEDPIAATHLFEANQPGYRGWRWAVTVTYAGPGTPVTISEVVLLPGPDALVAPEWVPWQQRVAAGDLGVGDLMPPIPGDPRLAPAYLESVDSAVEEVATEIGLGRVQVMSRQGRLDNARRWRDGSYGPRSEMARSAPERCGTCGFYLPVAGSLRAAFGVCGNEISPADGHVVHVEFGCGAHSEVELDVGPSVPVADLVYDDSELDIDPAPSQPAGLTGPEPIGPEAAGEQRTAVDPMAPEATVSDPSAPEAAELESAEQQRR